MRHDLTGYKSTLVEVMARCRQQQAIAWTNVDPVHWCIYAALGGDELMQWNLVIVRSIDSTTYMYSETCL